jgi:hypothetical protein
MQNAQPPLDDDDVGQPESPRQVLVPVPPQPPLDDDDVGQPESPRQVLLPIPHQQELARRRIAYALVTILGFEVLAALLLLLCVIEPLVIPIENLRTIMTIIFGPTVALVGSATGFYFGTSREANPPPTSESRPPA